MARHTGIRLDVLNLHWLPDLDADDLCAHGDVVLEIDGQPAWKDGTGLCVSASAMNLLRTLERDDVDGALDWDHLFPHCGHFWVLTDNGVVNIAGCPAGRHADVEHRGAHVIVTAPGRDPARILLSDWTAMVCAFADNVEAFYRQSTPKEVSADDREWYDPFWSEWRERRARAAPVQYEAPPRRAAHSPTFSAMSTALLIGATGLVGGHTLRRLAADDRWTRIVTLDRRPIPRASVQHEPHVVDFARLGDVEDDLFAADSFFCALGTTIKQAGSKDAFRRVDLEIPAEVARRAQAAGATQALLVSAMGADPGSRVFYNRVKGEAEAAFAEAGFEAVQIAQPSLLTGDRTEARTGEQIGEAVLGFLRPVLLGPLRNLRPTAADDVAATLVALAQARTPGVNRYDPEAIRTWAAHA